MEKVKHLGDITKLKGGSIPSVNVITFGSPCQGLSVAGKRKGFADDRSGLFIESVRLIKEMLEATNGRYPEFCIFENVPGLLSSNNGEDFITALEMMDELKFVPDPNIHDAQYCGVPQRRRRVGIVWVNVDFLQRKRTILSDSIMLQCSTEILLIILVQLLKVCGVEPTRLVSQQKSLSENGLKKRMNLCSLQSEENLKMWQERLDEIQAIHLNEPENSELNIGEGQMDLFMWMRMATKQDLKKGKQSAYIGKQWRSILEENSQLQNESIILTLTKETIISKISICLETLLNILDVTGVYLNAQMEMNPDVKNYFKWVQSILTVLKEYINARQTNDKSLKQLVGDDLLRSWNIRLRACDNKTVADTGSKSRSEVQSLTEGVSGDIEQSRETGKDIAAATGESTETTSGIGVDVYNQEITGDVAASKADNEHLPVVYCLQGNGIDRADTAGCNGKGWREDVSYTLNTIDRPAVAVSLLNDQGGNQVSGEDNATLSPTLRAEMHGNIPAVCEVLAFAQNQRNEVRDLGDKAGALQAEPGMKQQTYLCIENHPTDSRVKVSEDEICQTLSGRMGTGSDNTSIVMKTICIGNGQADIASHITKEVAQTLNCMHDQQAIVTYGLDRASFNQGINAKYDFSIEEEKSPTMVAKGANAVCRSVVRRLTPLECTRLQNYPDGWCDIGDWVDEKGKKHKDADSPKYKSLGNSVALPFWQWLIDRISAQYTVPPTLGSLFSGIGGFDLCWTRTNGVGTVLWESEIEPYPIAVAKQHFGDEDTGLEGDIEKYL